VNTKPRVQKKKKNFPYPPLVQDSERHLTVQNVTRGKIHAKRGWAGKDLLSLGLDSPRKQSRTLGENLGKSSLLKGPVGKSTVEEGSRRQGIKKKNSLYQKSLIRRRGGGSASLEKKQTPP